MDEQELLRHRSFVRRQGRITVGQARALELYGEQWLIPFDGALIDLPALFGRSAPVVMEIGFGSGQALLAAAEAAPERDFIGIEVYRSGIGGVIKAGEEAGLTNIRLIEGDAAKVLLQAIAPGALSELLLFFPDPWHKKRHNKRRLVQPAFAELVASRLCSKGQWLLATDWESYAQQMMAVLSANPGFVNLAGVGEFAPRPDARPITRFEARGQRLGHGVWDLAFQKAGDAS